MLRILAVDDDPDALRYLASVLSAEHRVDSCGGGSEALRRLESHSYDLVIADLDMPPPNGFQVLGELQRRTPPPATIVISGLDTARATIQALRLGARDYLVKPAAPEEILATVARVAAEAGLSAAGLAENFGLVGVSTGIARVRQLVPLLSRSTETVLLLGETGSGKELLARAIHEHGPRRSAPFVAHNMAATPAELAESLFFGHVRGAFSGATADHAGLFEQAENGTLFLDEIDSFPLALQAKLLRVLESSRVQRVGSTSERSVNVRVLAASAVELAPLVQLGAFRADLYYRLKQLEVVLPPLRERTEDIPILARHFLEELVGPSRRTPEIGGATMSLLLRHSWPGNCRELRNAVRSAALLAGDGPILPGHLPRGLPVAEGSDATRESPSELRAVEQQHIRDTLKRAGGNRSLAARLLGIDRGTLARKLGEWSGPTRSVKKTRRDDGDR